MVALGLFLWVKYDPAALKYVAFSDKAKDMSENIYRAAWSLLSCLIVTVGVSLFTRPKPAAELEGLVYGLTKMPSEGYCPWYLRPALWASVVGVLFVVVNVIFW